MSAQSTELPTTRTFVPTILTPSRRLTSTDRANVFVKWEGRYARQLVLNRFVFLAFEETKASYFAGNPDLNYTFFQQADVLAPEPSSIAQWEEQTISDGAQGINVCVGWYDTKTISGGWANIVTVQNTGAGGPRGTEAILNDGSVHMAAGGWAPAVTWNVEGKLWVDLHYGVDDNWNLPFGLGYRNA